MRHPDASLLVFVEITLNRGAPDVFEQFNAAVQKLEEIQECHLVSGDFDYLLKTRVPDMSAYRKLLGETLLRPHRYGCRSRLADAAGFHPAAYGRRTYLVRGFSTGTVSCWVKPCCVCQA